VFDGRVATNGIMADDRRGVSGKLLRDYNRRLAMVRVGMVQAQVEEILGRPSLVLSGRPTAGPTATFASLGLHLDFGELDADEVWAFRDPYRPRRVDYFAFRSGQLCSAWRDTHSRSELRPPRS
jgi:hypothetical protein